MKTTTFANRHIGIGEEELPLMLKKLESTAWMS